MVRGTRRASCATEKGWVFVNLSALSPENGANNGTVAVRGSLW